VSRYELWELTNLIRGVTPKSVGQVLKHFEADAGPSGEFLIAVLDRDRLAEHVPGHLPKRTCRQALFDKILSHPQPRVGRKELVLLEQNLESFLEHLLPHLPPSLQADARNAIAKKGRGLLQSRDLVLQAVSESADLRRAAMAFGPWSRLVRSVIAQLPPAPGTGNQV
jgi:hypothetical protein